MNIKAVLKSLMKDYLVKTVFIVHRDYENVVKYWNKSLMKTMKDYHDLYLESDALLLADVPEKFRNNSLKFFLCLSNYFSAPSLS